MKIKNFILIIIFPSIALGATPVESVRQRRVSFEWDPIESAKSYEIELKPLEKNGQLYVFKSNVARWSGPLKLGHYQMRLRTLDARGVPGPWGAPGPLDVLQQEKKVTPVTNDNRLPRPVAETPSEYKTKELTWRKPQESHAVTVSIARWNTRTNDWVSVLEKANVVEERIDFNPEWPAGTYQLSLVATAPARKDSYASITQFSVTGQNRNAQTDDPSEPESQQIYFNGWFGLARFMVGQEQYSGQNFDHSILVASSFQTTGTQTQLGVGHLAKNQSWGFFSLGDIGTLTTNQGTQNPFSFEADALLRLSPSVDSEIRFLGGVFYKEYVVVESDTTGAIANYDKASVIGPKLGVEVRYAISREWSVRLTGAAYEGLLKTHLSNGKNLDPQISTQLGISGAYRISPRVTTLLGILQQSDQFRYQSVAASPTTPNFENQTSIAETYFNLSAELNF